MKILKDWYNDIVFRILFFFWCFYREDVFKFCVRAREGGIGSCLEYFGYEGVIREIDGVVSLVIC